MNRENLLSKLACGLLGIGVILSSGCAHNPHRQPMHIIDLQNFKVDCRIREQQINMLQQMLTSDDDRLLARLNVYFQPWHSITDPETYVNRASIGSKRTDWLIRQHLLQLRDC